MRWSRWVLVGILVAWTAAPAAAENLVFADGFESGSTCAWGGTCPPPTSVSGTWRFSLDFAGQSRELVVQLHQRAGGRLIGYLLGGTPRRVVTAGSYAGGNLALDLLLERPDGARAVHLAATVAGPRATGTATGDLGTQPLVLTRWDEPLEERRWIAVDLDAPVGYGSPSATYLAIVLRPSGELVTGGFAAAEMAGCLWACDGGITAFTVSGPTVTFGLETDGGCSAGSTASATFDAGSELWIGSATFTDCSGTRTGPILAGPTTATRSDHAGQLLAAISGVADQLEAGTPFTAPHPSFADDYFHEGRDLATTLADLDAELAAWTDIEVDLARVRRISTIAVPDAPFLVARPHGLELEESRSGVPAAGGPREVYLDPATNPFDDIHENPLAVAAFTPGGWRLSGDHQPPFDLPLATEPVTPTDTMLRVATPGGHVHVSLSPWGGHFEPVTGHLYGDGKANLSGFLIADESELDELVGDGVGDDDGICESGETCAYWGGPDGAGVRDRVPTYIAPHDAEVTSVLFYSAPTGTYFDNPPQWRVWFRTTSRVEMRLDHVGAIAAPLADAVAAATGCDPRTWELCGLSAGDDLLAGIAPLPVAAGTSLARPQVLANPVPGYPGYYVGGGGFLEFPWAQLEFFSNLPVEIGATEGCNYLLYPRARRAALAGVMERDMADPLSLRYRDRSTSQRWAWSAEGVLCAAPTKLPADFRSLTTNSGAWYERTDAGTTADEMLALVPMHPESSLYDPGNYDPSTALLIGRLRRPPLHYVWTLPDASLLDVFYPLGELRELDADSFLVAWRDLPWAAGSPPLYQRAAYRLDDDGLTVRWGAFAADAASAAQPVLPVGAPCDELEILCYAHQSISGF